MLTNKQSLLLSALVIIGFFIAGITDFIVKEYEILDNLIVKIIFGSLFLLIVINLFLNKKDVDDDFENTFKKDDNYL